MCGDFNNDIAGSGAIVGTSRIHPSASSAPTLHTLYQSTLPMSQCPRPARQPRIKKVEHGQAQGAVPLTLVIVGALLLGSLPGISIGSYLATRISDRFLLPALASMLVVIGLRLVAS